MKKNKGTDENLQYKLMIDNMFDGYAYHRIVLKRGKPVNYIFTEVNPAFERMIGREKKDIIGKKVTEVIPTIGNDRFNWIETYGRVALTGETIRFENYSEALNKWFAIHAFSFEKGNFAVVFRDITEEKRLLAELVEEKERLSVTLHSIGDGVITTDNQGRVTMMNMIAEKLTGWRSDEAIGRPMREIFHIINEETREICEDPILKVLETEDILELTRPVLLIAKDGTERFIADSAAPIMGKKRNMMGVVLVFRDVTEGKKQEDEIRYLSYHDILTGLYNRTFFEVEKKRLDQAEYLPLSLIIGDVNGLKLANDIFGHEIGDRLLKSIARILMEECPHDGIIARWGGDEFVVILPRTSKENARALCNSIRKHCQIMPENPIRPNITLGVATKETASRDINLVLIEAEDLMYRRKLLEGKSVRSSIITSLEKTLHARSFETEKHAERILEVAVELGRELKLTGSELDELSLLSLLHDIGKIGIRDNILSKPCSLTKEEWQEMKRHPEIGYRIAQSSPELAHVADLILSHHERWDGQGYPLGLKEHEIPQLARIVAIIDAYDVMTHPRPYKKAVSHSEALKEIRHCAGTQFDPEIVKLFTRVINRKIRRGKKDPIYNNEPNAAMS